MNPKTFSEIKQSCSVSRVTIKYYDDFIKTHYLKRRPAIVTLAMGLFMDIWAVGIAVFSEPPKQTKIRYGCETWEFSRLWVSDTMPRNTETWFMAKSIKFIKANYPHVKMLVSYADPSAGHTGTIYKAGNWTFDGMTDAERKTPRHDYICNGKKYSRRSHIPNGMEFERVARVSKYRFIYRLRND